MAKTTDTVSFETGMLAYARSLQISEGVFFGVKGDREIPIEVLEKGVRGQSSEDKTPNPGKSNPQTVEFAVLPQGCTDVKLQFSVRVLPKAMAPHACGDPGVAQAYKKLATEYAHTGGFDVLAELYTWNIANARFAWRNRFQVDVSTVSVDFANETIAFDPSRLDLEEPADRNAMAAAMVEGDRAALDRFIAGLARGLTQEAFCFDVAWTAEMEAGQEIFPSQEYVREARKEKDLSRVYAKLPTFHGGREIGQASMHSQKIGVALRHIDIWHGDDTFGAIAVNPYGGVQETGDVLRKTKGNLYGIRKKAEAVFASMEGAQSTSEIPDDVHFMMANLVRGGVFGKKSAGSGE